MAFKIGESYREEFYSKLPDKAVDALSEISNLLIKNQSNDIDLKSIKEASISLEKNLDKFLNVESNAISFAGKEYFVLAYANYICQNEIIVNPSNTDKTIKKIQEADWNLSQLVDEHLLMEEVFICLSKNHGYKTIQLVNDLVKSREDFWAVYHPLCKSLMVIDFEIDDLISFLLDINEFRRGDLMSGYISKTFTHLAKHKIEVAKEIKAKFLASESEDLVYLLPSLFVELSKNDFENIYTELYKFTKSKKYYEINFGANTLGRLDYTKRDDYYEETQKRLRKLLKSEDSDIKAACCRSINFLIQNGKIDSGELLLNMNLDSPEIQVEISWLLLSNKKAVYETDWCNKLFFSICDIDAKHDSITSHIDQFLSFLMDHNKKTVEKFLNKWIDCHENNALDIPKVFSSLMIKLKNDILFLQSLISNWFNSDDSKFHLATGHVTSYFFKSEEKEGQIFLELDEKVVESFDLRDAKYVVYKILGYVINSHQKCSLVFSLLKNNTVSEIKDLVANAFLEVILYEYPVRKDFLERKKVTGNTLEKETAEAILNEFNNYEDSLDSLEKLKELIPSRHKLRAEQLIERERRKQIQEGARESSVFLDVIKKVTIKYGRGWTYYQDGKIQPPSYMASISTTFPVPRTIFINPVDAQFQSIQWRMISREEVL